MQAKTERFEMRLDQSTLERLDQWRASQSGLPSRSEAVRQLIEPGLSMSSPEAVQISDGERLIIHMLCDLNKHLEIRGDIDTDFVKSALIGGHHWALEWETGVFHRHDDDRRILEEVVDILDMWDFLESGYESLSKAEKRRVADEVGPLGENVKFLGFDGNNESEHMHIAHFLVNNMQRFTRFSGRELNSHCPVVESYRRMYAQFSPARKNIVGRELGDSEIIDILQARSRP